MKVDQLSKFISTYAYSSPKKVRKLEFEQLTERKYNSGALCGAKSSNLCFIYFAEGPDVPALANLKPVIEAFETDPVSFTYVSDTKMAQALFEGNQAVLYKPKRKRFMAVSAGSPDELRNAVSDALSGMGTWKASGALVFEGEQTKSEL